MALTELLQILIDADAKGAQRELQAFGRTAERELSRTDEKLRQLSGNLTKFGAAALTAGGVAAVGLFKLASAAGDLGEAQNKANVILGTEGAAALENYAKTAAKTAGISKRAALEAGGQFALFGKQAGLAGDDLGKFSADLVQLAGDIASIQNLSTEDALAGLASSLAGETRAARQLGFDISEATLKAEVFAQTGEKVTGTLTQQQKVQSISNLLFKQGAQFMGDFENTSDSLANRQRALSAAFEDTQAAIGEGLLPLFDGALGGVQRLVAAFDGLPQGTKAAAGGIAGVATAATVTVGGLALLTGAGLKSIDVFRDLGTRFRSSSGEMSRLGGVASSTGRVLGAAGIAGSALLLASALNEASRDLSGFSNTVANLPADRIRFDATTQDIDLLRRAIDQSNGALDEFQNRLLNFTGLVGTVDLAPGLTVPLTEVKRTVDSLIDNGSLEEAAALVDLLAEAISDPERNNQNFGNRNLFGRFADEVLPELRRELELASNAAAAAAEGVASGAADAAPLIDEQAEALERSSEAADKLKGALGRLAAVQKLSSLQFEIGKQRADSFADALDRSTSADNILQSAVTAGRALRSLQRGLGLIPDDARKTEKSTDAAADAMTRLNDAATASDPAVSRFGIALGSARAAASAFSASLEAAGGFGARLGSALGVGDAFREFSKTFRRLPDELDLVEVSLGKLRPRTAEAVRNVLALGEATTEYLATLIRSGQGTDRVRQEAARLREEFARQLSQLGLTSEQLQQYLELTGTAPEQIETAIRLSNLEASRFKLNAYISLLTGRIPPEVATQVIASVESGNLDEAAGQLERFAASNPVRLEVSAEGGAELREAGNVLFDLPKRYDPVIAAVGRYSDAQYDALDAVLQLGGAARDYLTKLVGAGEVDAARTEAGRLRAEYALLFEQLGLNQSEIEAYYELLGIAPDQIETAIAIANFDATVFQITTVLSLLEGIGELEPEVALQLADATLRGDYEAVLAILERQVEIQLGADTDQATIELNDWLDLVPLLKPRVPVGADTSTGDNTVRIFGLDIERGAVAKPEMPVDGNTKPLDDKVNEARNIYESPWVAIKLKVDGDLTPLQERLAQFDQTSLFGIIGAGMADGSIPRRAGGGPVRAGQPYIVGEKEPELFVPSTNGMILNSSQMGGGGVTIQQVNVTAPVTERTPEQVALGVRNAMFLAGVA